MIILVTGALGFVGSNFLELIFNNKNFERIYILDNNSINLSKNYIPIGENPKITIINHDITKKLNLNFKIDIILHLAAAGNVVESVIDPLKNLESNVIGTLNILEFAKKSGVSKFIFSSTGGALMGDTLPPVNETSNPKPISPYGASKLSCEGYISAYSNMYKFKSFILRFGNVFGPYCFHKKGVINKLFNSAIHNESFKVYGDGTSSRDYIYVKDISKAILSCILNDSNDLINTFHLSTGIETSLIKLIDIVEQISNKKLKVEFLPSRVGEVYRNFADFSKAKKELNFQPSQNIKPLILESFNWFKSYKV